MDYIQAVMSSFFGFRFEFGKAVGVDNVNVDICGLVSAQFKSLKEGTYTDLLLGTLRGKRVGIENEYSLLHLRVSPANGTLPSSPTRFY
jgi:hypothetical protein